jgi:hypothetical protein
VPIEAACPACGRRYVLASNLVGERVLCVGCGTALEVPEIRPPGDVVESLDEVVAVEVKAGSLRRFLVGGLVVIALILASCGIIVAMVLPGVLHAREQARIDQCKRNLRRIGAAMLLYAKDHAEKFPEDMRGPLYALSLLYPQHVDDPAVLVCPSAPLDTLVPFPPDSSLAGCVCSYTYDQVTASSSTGLTPSTVILREPPRIHGRKGGHVLCADGHVEWREDERREANK